VRVLPGLVGQADHLQQLVGAPPAVGRAVLAHPQPEAHVVQGGHVREQAVALEHHAHVPPGRGDPGDVLAVDGDRAGIGRLEAGQDPQRRGLAAARRAEQRDQLARRDVQRQPMERADGAKGAGQVAQGDRRAVAAGPGNLLRRCA
jgi:hypothetical protein